MKLWPRKEKKAFANDAAVEVSSGGDIISNHHQDEKKKSRLRIMLLALLVSLVLIALGVVLALVLQKDNTNKSSSSTSASLQSQADQNNSPVSQTQMPVPEPTMPNIDWLFKGYDIMYGDPFEKADPGFRKTIFDATYQYRQTTDDGRYFIPDKVSAHRSLACDMTFKSEIIESSQQFISSMSARASVEGSGTYAGVTAAFSASGGYQEASERFNKEGQIATQAEASCSVYQAEINNYDLPTFSTNFVNALDTLADDLEYEVYDSFVREYGTHYVNKMTMGAVFVEQSFITWQDRFEMEDSGFDIAVSAAASGYGAAAKVGAEYEEHQASRNEFRSKARSQETYTRGSLPPDDGNVNLWVKSVQEDPAPTLLILTRIDNLIKPLVNDKVYANLQEVLNGYCTKLVSDNVIASCTAPGPAPGGTRAPTSLPTPQPTVKPAQLCEGTLGEGLKNGIDLYGYGSRLTFDSCRDYSFENLYVEWRYTHKNGDDSNYPYEVFVNGESQGNKRGSHWARVQIPNSPTPGVAVQIKCHAGVNFCRGTLNVKQYECPSGREHSFCPS